MNDIEIVQMLTSMGIWITENDIIARLSESEEFVTFAYDGAITIRLNKTNKSVEP